MVQAIGRCSKRVSPKVGDYGDDACVGDKKAFTFAHLSVSFSAFMIIVQKVPDETGTDPRPGPVAEHAMEPAANELAAEKSADDNGERNELPTQA